MKRKEDFADYKKLASRIRIQVLKMIHRTKACHVGSSFSIADLLAVLYSGALRIDPAHPDWNERDRFILSKGHAATAAYAILAERNFFPKAWLETYYQDGSFLAGHTTRYGVPGVEVSTGSLGHGLPIGCGMALIGRRENRPYRIFVLLGDGECDEGSVWEAALFAGHHKLDNLVAIVDYNKIQGFGRVEEVMNLEPFSKKWQAFGWQTKEIDGHDFRQIEKVLSGVPFKNDRPSCIIAHTIKGKGVSFMENNLLWHYRAPDDGELRQALAELEESK